ncbi:MAG: adenylate cyclase [Pseudomonadales bacterium]|nr:adenylate cyclase [Pseudomonadales bacterium]
MNISSSFTSTPNNTEPPAQYIRTMAYLVIASTFAAGIYSGLYDNSMYWIIAFNIFYPFISYGATTTFQRKYPKATQVGLILVDCILCGAAIVFAKFNITPTIALLILANASIMRVAGLQGWIASLASLGLGISFTLYFFGFEVVLETPLVVTIVAATGIIFYISVISYYWHGQSRRLEFAQSELKKQKESSAALSRKLSKYLPPQVWGSIFDGQSETKLETQRKKLTVFFSDIKGFSEISEELQPEALTELLNSYFTEMSRIASRYGGTIDKFVGDSIMIFFGDPSTQGSKEDALACVSMSIEMRKQMKVMRQKWREHGITKPLQIRMGINTGYCTVGNFGAEARMDYTIIGKEVNLASRLESVAQPGQIYISHDTYTLVEDLVMCRDKGSLNVKGFTKPVAIYEVVDFRKDLGASQSFVEHEFDGFSMYLDLEKVRNYEKEKIINALEESVRQIKKRLIV